jgi:hypothetical protein
VIEKDVERKPKKRIHKGERERRREREMKRGKKKQWKEK